MDRIALRGVRAYGRHGASPGERDDRASRSTSTSRSRSICAPRSERRTRRYARLCGAARASRGDRASTSFALLERLAGDLLAAIFADARVVRAEVSIAKPAILDGATPSVTLRRANPGYNPR